MEEPRISKLDANELNTMKPLFWKWTDVKWDLGKEETMKKENAQILLNKPCYLDSSKSSLFLQWCL